MVNLLPLCCFVIGIKLLLSFCYYSTDFEVHRNWLAITYSLPVEKWYYENTSIWTLDYPPFFAYFERCLAEIGVRIDPEMIKISENAHPSYKTIIFQRISVIFCDIFYMFASVKCAKALTSHFTQIENRKPLTYFVIGSLLISNGGLLLVDSIHFQYNGMLFGIFLLSITAALQENYFLCALYFAVLLNFKHIFAYIAPAYVIFLLKNYCFTSRSLSLGNCLKLGSALIITFGLSFGPFLRGGHFMQILQRLFPFKRGLTHAYWAPNFWAFYNFLDLVLNNIAKKVGNGNVTQVEYTSGLVQEFQHTILPNISPLTCFILTLTFILPFMLIAFFTNSKQKFDTFLKLINLCAFSSYMFGWHVHEKAILMCIVPLNLLAFQFNYVKLFLLSITVGIFSLFPLIFTEFETVIKYCIWLLYCIFGFYGLQAAHKFKPSTGNGFFVLPFLNVWETLYVFGFLLLEFYCSLLHYLLKFDEKFKFLPLMLTSVYCSVGILYVWLLSCWQFLCDELSIDTKICKFIWKRRQLRLNKLLIFKNSEKWQSDFDKELKLIAGLDISTTVGDDYNAIVCLVILKYPSMEVVCIEWEQISITAPYVPSYLAFREAPPLINILKRFIFNRPALAPQVVIIDGNGYLHPRKFGLACHVGVSLDICTIGVSKNFHYIEAIGKTTHEALKEFSSKDDTAASLPLCDENQEVLGCALKTTKSSKNPIFVSVGHKISLDTAVTLVKKCSLYRIPEPTRQADIISRKIVQELLADNE